MSVGIGLFPVFMLLKLWMSLHQVEISCLKKEYRLLVPKATILIENKISKLLSSSEQLLLDHLLKSVPIMHKLSEKLVIYSMLKPKRTA